MSYGYAPPPPPPLAPSMGLPRKSSKWWFAPVIVLAALVVLAAFVGGLVAFVFGFIKSSEPYQHAVNVATQNPEVARELGEPVTPGWLLTGNIQTSGSSGHADLAIPLNGRLHHGTVYVVAKKERRRVDLPETECAGGRT